MDQNSTYDYQPLLEADGIRLLVLQPSQDINDKVECSLVHTTLSKYENEVIDHYTALSYVWGDEKVTRTISIGGCDRDVTANLESALRHLRDSLRTRNIWADAVCINQSDDEEKGQQVSQMGDVYKFARQTIIYLGDSDEESDLFLGYVQSSNSMYQNAKNTASADQSNASSHWAKILDFRWFTRIWIFQELVLSRDPWVQCGKICVRWRELSRSISSAQGEGSDAPNEPLKIFDSMNERWKSYQESARSELWTSPSDLISILEDRRGLGVFDPRDMLFAHLGIVHLYDRDQLVNVDYTKTTRRVYEDLALYLLTNFHYEILSHRDFIIDAGTPKQSLPTWAPDWTAKKLSPQYPQLRDALSIDYSGSRFKFTSKDSTHFRIAPSVFGCVGFRIGKISRVSSVITSPQASFTISDCDEFLKPPFAGNWNYYYKHHLRAVPKAWAFVYEHWQGIIEPLLIDSKLAHSTTLEMNVLVKSKYVPFSKDLFAKPTEDNELEYLAHRSGLSDRENRIQRLATHLLLHAVDGYFAKHSPFLYGRKFATLEDGTLCLVPASTEAGDFTCFFFGDPRMPYVIRPKNLELERVGLLSDSSILGKIPMFGKVQVSHFELVGTCWVDKWMRGEQFWNRTMQLGAGGPLKQHQGLHSKDRDSRKVKKEGWRGWLKREEVDTGLLLDVEILALH